jgi:hypothetical protein
MEGPLSLETPQAVRHAVLDLTLLARQSLNIYTPDLDPLIFDQRPFLDALRRLAIGHQHARIRILLRDPRRVVKDGHRVIALAHRLSTRIALRVPGPDHQDYGSQFLVVDDAHVLFDPAPDRYTARMTRADRPRARELMVFFDEVWAHAHRHPDLRELRL